MIKLIATDLDGTLFYPKNHIGGMPRTNRKFIRSFLNQGGELVLITGRNSTIYHRVQRLFKKRISILGCNGSFLFDGKEYLRDFPMDNKELLKLYLTFKDDYGILAWMLFDKEKNICCTEVKSTPSTYIPVMNIGNRASGFYREHIIYGEEKFLEQLQHGKNYKMMPVFGLGKAGKKIAHETAVAILDRVDSFKAVNSSNSVEITSIQGDKGKGLEEFCRIKGISADEVFVCGDSGNDLAMFSAFPHSFAMSHASEGFKKQANHVIDRLSDLQKYLDHEESYKNDVLKEVDFEKGMETI